LGLTNRMAAQALRKQTAESNALTRGEQIERDFLEQIDAYYSSPASSFHDNAIAKRFYTQRLNHLGWKPYPKDGLVTFGASGTGMCDRQIVFKNGGTKPEKSDDLPSRGRQRRQGSAIIEYLQLDIAHMQKRLGDRAKFVFVETKNGEYAMEDAAQSRKVIEHNGVQFAITAKPDGILQYGDDRLIFEYKTKATGITEMNGKLDFKGIQDDHFRQLIASSIVFGIREGLIAYESTQKPSWFSDEENKNVPKTRKTWRDGSPVSDFRPFHFYVTDEMQTELLDDLARQAKLVYAKEVPEMTVEFTGKCGFCPFTAHCKSLLTDDEKALLFSVEENYAKHPKMNGNYAHRNLRNYLDRVSNG
jgi:hypothetical protein